MEKGAASLHAATQSTHAPCIPTAPICTSYDTVTCTVLRGKHASHPQVGDVPGCVGETERGLYMHTLINPDCNYNDNV